MGDSEYLPVEREAMLLAVILSELPGPGDASGAGDRILCELIEMGLADADRGPAMYQHWCKMPALEQHTDQQERLASLVRAYLGEM